MLNCAIGKTLNDALDTKDLYKRVLDALVAALEKADWAGLGSPSVRDFHGQTLCWVYDDTARCPDCGGKLWILVPGAAGTTTTLQFCPQTLDLTVLDANGRMVAAVTRRMEAMLRSLPPGPTVTSIEIEGGKGASDPPYVAGKDRDREGRK
jgi:hypothetical protein